MAITAASPTILFVDDEDLFRSTAVDSLQRLLPGYSFLQAANGLEALSLADENPIDVVVTDIRMPEMGGTELLVELTARGFRGRSLVVSAFGDNLLERQALELGALFFLEKPVELTDLAHAIRSAAQGRRSLVEGVSLAGFSQLVTLERKTGRLRVSTPSLIGDLFFQQGQLHDAKLGELRGEEAALEILGWSNDAKLEFLADLPPRTRSIERPLQDLLLNAMRLQDEGGARLRETLPLGPVTSVLDPVAPDEFPTRTAAEEAVEVAMTIEGALGVALVDTETGMTVGQAGGGEELDLDLASAGNTAVVRAKLETMSRLGIDDEIEDILITLGTQYHLIRLLRHGPSQFLYLAMDRQGSNLAMARHRLAMIERGLQSSLP